MDSIFGRTLLDGFDAAHEMQPSGCVYMGVCFVAVGHGVWSSSSSSSNSIDTPEHVDSENINLKISHGSSAYQPFSKRDLNS
jgi:hypothetical protein